MNKLPIYTDHKLETNQFYTTLVIDGSYYPDNSEVNLINENNTVKGVARIVRSTETKMDYLGYEQLKNCAAPRLKFWHSACDYFKQKYKDVFRYDGVVQLVTFEVKSAINFDTPLVESVEEEKELGLPTDVEMFGEDKQEETPVVYKLED